MKTQIISLKKSLSSAKLMLMWAMLIFNLISIGNVKAQNPDLYLDSVAAWSVNHFCITDSGVNIHQPAGVTVIEWVYGGNSYNGSVITVPHTFNGSVGCFYGSGSKTIDIIFDQPAVSSGISDQTFCGSTPVTLNALNPNAGGYLWWNGATAQTTTVNTSGTYWLDIYSACNTTPIHDVFNLHFVAPVAALCGATYNPISAYNQLVWDGSDPDAIWAIIMKRSVTNVMENIDTMPYTIGLWIDASSTPNDMAEYALRIIDGCGNVSDTSIHHITMWTTISDFGNEVNFSVTPYVGVPVNTITLYGITALGVIDSIKSTAFHNTSLPDSIANNYSQFYFSFDISCGGAKSVLKVKSNVVQGISTGLHDEYTQGNVVIFPNPTKGLVTIDINEDISKNDQIYVSNIYGSCILTVKNTKTIDLSPYPCGVYTVTIRGNKANFVTKILKL